MNSVHNTIETLQGMDRLRVNKPKSIFERHCNRLAEDSDFVADKYIIMTYEIVSPEDAEYGEPGERGFSDEQHNHYETFPEDIQGNEEPPRITFELDEYDREDGITVVDKVVEFLENEGAEKEGSAEWFTSYGSQEPSTGGYTNYNYHLYGFTAEEVEEIKSRL